MKRLIPLALLALGACDAPLEQLNPRETVVIDHPDRTFYVRAQYDPFELEWATRVWSPYPSLTAEERDTAIAVVEKEVGPILCNGRPMKVGDGEIWNSLAGTRQQFLESAATWQLVGTCN